MKSSRGLVNKAGTETLWIYSELVWVQWSWPRRRIAGCGAGYAWAPSILGSSSSGPPGWCWSPSAHSPASQKWPIETEGDGGVSELGTWWVEHFVTRVDSKRERREVTSRSIMSLGRGTSGFSPVSTIGMLAFLISFSTNPVREQGLPHPQTLSRDN